MVGRRSVWSKPELIELSAQFVPTADVLMNLTGRCLGTTTPGESEAFCVVALLEEGQNFVAFGGTGCDGGAICDEPFSQNVFLTGGTPYVLFVSARAFTSTTIEGTASADMLFSLEPVAPAAAP